MSEAQVIRIIAKIRNRYADTDDSPKYETDMPIRMIAHIRKRYTTADDTTM